VREVRVWYGLSARQGFVVGWCVAGSKRYGWAGIVTRFVPHSQWIRIPPAWNGPVGCDARPDRARHLIPRIPATYLRA